MRIHPFIQISIITYTVIYHSLCRKKDSQNNLTSAVFPTSHYIFHYLILINQGNSCVRDGETRTDGGGTCGVTRARFTWRRRGKRRNACNVRHSTVSNNGCATASRAYTAILCPRPLENCRKTLVCRKATASCGLFKTIEQYGISAIILSRKDNYPYINKKFSVRLRVYTNKRLKVYIVKNIYKVNCPDILQSTSLNFSSKRCELIRNNLSLLIIIIL